MPARPRKRVARSTSKRHATKARADTVRRLPDDAFDPESPVSIWRGVVPKDQLDDRKRVILTRTSVRLAVLRLVRLAALWEATDELATASKELREHSARYLIDVVALLDVYERDLPIAVVDGFRITPDDANLVIVHSAVVATLREYAGTALEQSAVDQLAWMLGNSYRVPRAAIERAWQRLSSKATKNWVTEHRGPIEAAKLFLGHVLPGAGGRRIGSLRKFTRQVGSGRDFSRDVVALFAQRIAQATGATLQRSGVAAYVKKLFDLT